MENASVQRGLFLTFRLFSLIRHALRRATFPVGEGYLRRGRRSEVLRIYAPVPPGRLHPSSVRAVGPATFPVGEGDLRRGCSGGGT